MKTQEISVVLATNNSGRCVMECLDSLERQTLSASAEIIVADGSTDGSEHWVRARYPNVKLLHFDRPVGLPVLVREGLRLAQGRIVAITDPYCTFPPDWLEKLLRAHEKEHEVIGGAVELGHPNGLVSWACYFADYAAFMLPNERKLTLWLAGNHVSYKREAILPALASMEDGFWKVFFHWDLSRRGVHSLFDPDLIAFYQRQNTVGSFLRNYFRHAWFFAAIRTKRMARAVRIWHVVTVPALPLLLLFQRLGPGLRNKRHRAKFLLSIPLLALFVTVWSAGELIGYLLGPAGLPKGVYR